MQLRDLVHLCLLQGLMLALTSISQAEPRAEVELLHNIPSTVLVSSALRNGKNRPEHLVDGQLDTAWNSQSDVASRSYIDFVVPAAAHVRSIRLTAGFTSHNEKGDLFLMNHRITKVQVFRNRISLGTFALDPNQRGLQELPIDKPGGHYRVQFVRTLAGTNDKWTEACVSEFQVYGFVPPGTLPKSQTPTVLVGGILAPRTAPISSLTAFCEQWAHHLAEAKPELDFVEKPYCRLKIDARSKGKAVRSSLTTGQSPFLAAQLVEVADRAWDTLLALRTPQGWFLYPMFSGMAFDDTGCAGYEESSLLDLRGGTETLVLRYRNVDVTHAMDEGERGRRVVTEYIVTCTVGDVEAPLCLKQLVSLKWASDRL